MIISFLGFLPLGTLNTTAFYIAAAQNTYEALQFVGGVVLVELIIVRIALYLSSRIFQWEKITIYLLPIGAMVLVYLGISSIGVMGDVKTLETTSALFPFIVSPFVLGLFLCLFNPMHLPFWFGCNSFLTSKKILISAPGIYNSYLIGIGIGSIASLVLFVYAGEFAFLNYQQYCGILNLVLGWMYLLIAGYLIVELYRKHLKLKLS